MASIEFELFLDESGNFNDITGGDHRLSLVGGLMTRTGAVNEKKAKEVLMAACEAAGIAWPKDNVIHANKLPKDKFPTFALSVFDQLSREETYFIIFENSERILIVDPDITYLNMLSEGITQLFSTLNAKYNRTIKLSVNAARRMIKDKNYQGSMKEIKSEEYTTRLMERMHWSWVRRGVISGSQSWVIKNLNIGSALRDYPLMLADVICHAWFTRNTKFKQENQKEHLLKLMEENGYTYGVIEHGSVNAIERLVAEGALGEAFFEACSYMAEQIQTTAAYDQSKLIKTVDSLIASLVKLPAGSRDFHLSVIRGRVNYIITEGNYSRALLLLELIQQQLIDQLDQELPETEKNSINLMTLETVSAALAIANHRGNIGKAQKYINQVKKIIPKMARRWENFQYIMEFLFLETVHKHNCYDFDQAINLMDTLEDFYNNTIELYPAALPGVFTEPIKSDIRGKILGNRLQALMFKGRSDYSCYELARRDSDAALVEFENFSDKSRHFIYRCHIETDAGDIQAALKYLAYGLNNGREELELPGIAKLLADDSNNDFKYCLMQYSRIMAAAVLTGNKSLANEMEEHWSKYKLDGHPVLASEFQEHPREIICWKKGTYYLCSGSIKAGLEWHRKAQDICFRDEENITLLTIGMGMLAEQAAILATAGSKYKKEYKNAIKSITKTCATVFHQPDLPQSFVEYFAQWPETLAAARDENEDISAKLFQLARMIPF